ncbi:MAG: rod shape-determining protein MreD [Betaproteobacteria bacterium]|nr:rod shape-determining protein MreD [Betaproteobacteria bacterium]
MSYVPQPQRILLQVKVGFIVFTLAAALLINLLPWRDISGLPDMLALVLAFWCIHQPRRVGIGIAWLLGILTDVSNGALLGQHAFAYSMLAFAALALHRRILWFSLSLQAMHVLVLLLGCQLLMLCVRLVAGNPFPGFAYFFGPVVAAALWPLSNLILLAPQRKPESVDENRPI